jgi:phosphoribosylamine--glycine ligase
MKVCVVGSGGREHALATTLARTAEVVVTPGNPGIAGSTAAPATGLDADLYVIGPEQPLVDGLADELRAAGKLVFGPGRDGARLEGSKAWMKELFVSAGIPTARHGTFTDEHSAKQFLETLEPPYVIKTDGLAAGKGVLVTDDIVAAVDGLRDYLSGDAFGTAGRTLIVEEGLVGPEVSVFAITDGHSAVLLPPAQDHKRIGEGDTGPNTGGMGAYTPVPVLDAVTLELIRTSCIQPTIDALRARGIDYRGVLYAGVMLTADGPKLLEYNVRFGDPECQVLVPLIETDLAQLLAEAAAGELRHAPRFSTDAALTVVCASEGYPEHPRTGDEILGLEAARAVEGVEIFCAGVSAGAEGALLTAGGRVLNVTGRAASLEQAAHRAYAAAAEISWPGLQLRRDIGATAL